MSKILYRKNAQVCLNFAMVQRRASTPRSPRLPAQIGPWTLALIIAFVMALALLAIAVPWQVVSLLSESSSPPWPSLSHALNLPEEGNATAMPAADTADLPPSNNSTAVVTSTGAPLPISTTAEQATQADVDVMEDPERQSPNKHETHPSVTLPVAQTANAQHDVHAKERSGRSPLLDIDIKKSASGWQREFLASGGPSAAHDYRSKGQTRPWRGDFMEDGET